MSTAMIRASPANLFTMIARTSGAGTQDHESGADPGFGSHGLALGFRSVSGSGQNG